MKKFAVVISLILLLIPCKVFAIGESSTSITVMDMDSNRVIYSKNQNSKSLIASITKIMTAIIAIESGKIDDVVTVDDTILKAYGSGVYIEIGEKIKLKDLVYGLMLRSGNDAALMIAKYVGGSVEEFAKLMNIKAEKIGMKNTKFLNPHGLDEETENISTSYDMALLTSYAMKNETYKKIVGTKNYKVTTDKKTYVWKNKNRLLHEYKYTTGGKTGFTKKARRTLVTTASKNNMNLVVVTLNDPNDFLEHKESFEYVFKNFTKYRILNKKTFKVSDNRFDGKLYIKNDYYYLLKESEKDKMSLKVKLEEDTKNIKNNVAGVVEVMFDNKKIHEETIYLERKESKEKKKGFFSRLFS